MLQPVSDDIPAGFVWKVSRTYMYLEMND
jgi:hypothetical protein